MFRELGTIYSSISPQTVSDTNPVIGSEHDIYYMFGRVQFRKSVHVVAQVSGTYDSYKVTVEHSADGTNWEKAAEKTGETSGITGVTVMYPNRYVRALVQLAGETVDAQVSAVTHTQSGYK